MLDENDVIEAVCKYLEQQGFDIKQRLDTSQRGIDIKAEHSVSGQLIYIEAKGGTSSQCGSKRYGKPFTNSQVFDRTAKGIYTLLQMYGNQITNNCVFALAVPDTELFRKHLEPVKENIAKLKLTMYLVTEDKCVSEL